MKKELIVIKFGGSIITDKESSTPKPNLGNIIRLVGEIKDIYSKRKYQIILVHGAGSFGHPLAKKYKLSSGMCEFNQKIGFGKTTESMLKLNSLVVDVLLAASVPAAGLPPHAFVVQQKGKRTRFDNSLIKSYITQDILPVLFGDCVLDTSWGCSIVSGDTLVAKLGKELRAHKIIFLSDVDGVFNKNPKLDKSSTLIKEITKKNLRGLLKALKSQKRGVYSRADVTGEMIGKILALKKELPKTLVYIVNGLKPGNLKAAVLKNNVYGTKIFFG